MSNRDRFDRFTERARKVLSLAQEEAQRFQHNYIGTEHLLLGLVAEGDGIAAKVLQNLGVELVRVRGAVEFIIGRGDRIVLGQIGLTPRAKKVVELAVDEARRMNHHYIGTEHLLLGLVREGEGIAAGVLESFGLNLGQVRRETLIVLNQAGRLSTQEPAPENQVTGSDIATSLDDVRERLARYGRSLTDNDGLATFTDQARRVLAYAQEEAQYFQHNYIGTEHLLLGLVREQDGIAAQVLRNLGASLGKVRSSVEFIIGRGDRIVLGEIGLTPRGKKIIELAVDESHLLHHTYVGTEHLLLGLISEGEGIAVGVLQSMGIELEQVRSETIRLLNKP